MEAEEKNNEATAVRTEEVSKELLEDFVDFEFGDLYIKCSCGHDEKFIEGIEGIRVELPATNKHNLRIVCSKCKHELMLYYKLSDNVEELREAKIQKKESYEKALAEVQKEVQEEIIGTNEEETNTEPTTE